LIAFKEIVNRDQGSQDVLIFQNHTSSSAISCFVYSGLDRLFLEIEGAKSDALRVIKSFSYDHEHAVESTLQFLMTLAKVPDIKNLNVVESKLLDTFLQMLENYPPQSGSTVLPAA
jgi:hypothetical protein